MTIVLGNQQGLVPGDCLFGLAAGVISRVGEVVVGVHILQGAALFQVSHAGGGTAGIQGVGNAVCHAVQLVIVLAFIDPHAPQHDAGMIPILQHHFPGVFHGLLLPVRTANVLPAGNLRKYQQSQPVALVQKIVALRIVGGAHGGAA